MLKVRGGILALAAATLTAIFYGRAWQFDLQCDDLLMIRPWSRAELAAVWHGTWEPGHAFATFFRPIATWFYAGTFELFGLNAHAHMLLSLAMLAAVAWLLALFVARESESLIAGAMAAFLYLVHPNVPWSTGTWVTNDFHKLTAISALCALLVWQRLRHKPWAHWLLLGPFAVLCFLVKEDGLMLIPALVSMQWARAKLVGDVKKPSLPFVAAAATFAIALFGWRYLALQELGGFDLPRSADAIGHNLARGPLYAFTLHGSLSVLTALNRLTAIAMFAIIGVSITLMPREKRFLPVAGLLLMFWYDLPLALISNVMRYYMLTIASVMVVVPVFLAISSPRNRPAYWFRALSFAMLVFVGARAWDQQSELAVFAPCQWAEHNCVTWVLEEVKTLPPEARWYIADTARACAVHGAERPHIGASGQLTWGLGPTSVDTITGERSWAITGDVVTLVPEASKTWIAVRHRAASAAQPVQVEISANGRRSTRDLTTPDWTAIEVEMTTGLRSWLRGAHRIDTRFSSPGAEWGFLGGIAGK